MNKGDAYDTKRQFVKERGDGIKLLESLQQEANAFVETVWDLDIQGYASKESDVLEGVNKLVTANATGFLKPFVGYIAKLEGGELRTRKAIESRNFVLLDALPYVPVVDEVTDVPTATPAVNHRVAFLAPHVDAGKLGTWDGAAYKLVEAAEGAKVPLVSGEIYKKDAGDFVLEPALNAADIISADPDLAIDPAKAPTRDLLKTKAELIWQRLGLTVDAANWGNAWTGSTLADDETTLLALLQTLETKIEAVELLGDFLSPSAATFATLPAVTVDNANDWSALTADDVGTGTVEAPQYPKGIYLTDGATWSLLLELSEPLALTLVEMVQLAGDAEYGANKSGLVNVKGLDAFHVSRIAASVDGAAPELYRKNTFFTDDTVGTFPTAVEGAWLDVVTYQIERANFDENNLPPFLTERWYAVQDPVTPTNFHWVSEGVKLESGNTKYTAYFTERLEAFWFDFHDRRANFAQARRQRYSLTVDELETGNADFVLNPAYASIPAQAGYTRLVGRYVLGAGPAGYDIIIDWRTNNNEYEICIQDNHNNAPDTTTWGINRFGGIDNVIAKSSATDPVKPTWQTATNYVTGDVVIAKAPSGVAETQDSWYVGEAQSDRNSIATLDAAEWANWTWQPLVPSKQDIVVATLADRPDPATLLSGSRVSIVADPEPANNRSYTVTGPVDGAGTGYSSAVLPIVYRGNNDPVLIGVENEYYQDDTQGALPTSPVGKEYAIGIVLANRADSKAIRDAAKVRVSHFRVNEDSDGVRETEAAAGGKNTIFADDTTVAPAVERAPTVAEIKAFADTDVENYYNTHIKYNGTDTDNDHPTRIYFVDVAGNVTVISEDDHSHQVLENIAVHVRSAGTNAASAVDIELLIDGAWNPTDWVVSTAPASGLESYTAHPALHLDKSTIAGPINIGHNKDGYLFFEYVGSATEGQLTGINYTGTNGANSDGQIIVNFVGTNYHVDFANKAAVEPTIFTKDEEIADELPIVYPGDTGAIQIGKQNMYYLDETVGTIPAAVTGQEYAIGIVQTNAGDTQVIKDAAKVKVSHWSAFDTGAGFIWLETESVAGSKPWVFSTDNMNAVDGDKIIVQPNHSINFLDTTDLQSVQLAPSTGNWSDIAAGSGSFNPDAAWTFGTGQTLLFGSDIITAISNLATTNWLLLSGGEDAPSQDERYETVALLPAPATANPGAMAIVYGDAIAANNGSYIARTDGITQTLSVAWERS